MMQENLHHCKMMQETLQWQYNDAAAKRQKSISPPNSNTQSFQRFGLRGSFYENVN